MPGNTHTDCAKKAHTPTSSPALKVYALPAHPHPIALDFTKAQTDSLCHRPHSDGEHSPGLVGSGGTPLHGHAMRPSVPRTAQQVHVRWQSPASLQTLAGSAAQGRTAGCRRAARALHPA